MREPARGICALLAAAGLRLCFRNVRVGSVLARAGDTIDEIIFPHTAIVSIVRKTPLDPKPLTVALVGYEGMIGWPALLGVLRSSHQAMVISAGEVGCISKEELLAALTLNPVLSNILHRVVHNHAVQLAQSVVANLGHSTERRLARWLLMLDDRTHGDTIATTHDRLSQLLNVRRPTVTNGLHVLEGEGLIYNSRGRVKVRDRAKLEARAGQSYGLSEEDYNVAIEPFGKSSRFRGQVGSFQNTP